MKVKRSEQSFLVRPQWNISVGQQKLCVPVHMFTCTHGIEEDRTLDISSVTLLHSSFEARVCPGTWTKLTGWVFCLFVFGQADPSISVDYSDNRVTGPSWDHIWFVLWVLSIQIQVLMDVQQYFSH